MLDLQKRIEVAQNEIEKTQVKNEKYYDKRARYRKFDIGDKILLLIPVKTNQMMLNWVGPYIMRDKVGEFHYRIEVAVDKVKTYHINMMKRYYEREAEKFEVEREERLATLVTVVNDGGTEQEEEMLELYNETQKETYRDVQINPDLSENKKKELKKLL